MQHPQQQQQQPLSTCVSTTGPSPAAALSETSFSHHHQQQQQRCGGGGQTVTLVPAAGGGMAATAERPKLSVRQPTDYSNCLRVQVDDDSARPTRQLLRYAATGWNIISKPVRLQPNVRLLTPWARSSCTRIAMSPQVDRQTIGLKHVANACCLSLSGLRGDFVLSMHVPLDQSSCANFTPFRARSLGRVACSGSRSRVLSTARRQPCFSIRSFTNLCRDDGLFT